VNGNKEKQTYIQITKRLVDQTETDVPKDRDKNAINDER
jgi:hypothetical protein